MKKLIYLMNRMHIFKDMKEIMFRNFFEGILTRTDLILQISIIIGFSAF